MKHYRITFHPVNTLTQEITCDRADSLSTYVVVID